MRHLKKFILFMIACLLGTVAKSQYQPMPNMPIPLFDNNGRPLAGGCLFTYLSGSNTPTASYKDPLGSTLNSNPVIADASGRMRVFLSATAYRLVLKTAGGTNCSTGVQIYSIDGINPSANSILGSVNVWTAANTWQSTSTFNGPTSFTTGFSSSGPANLNGGGAFSGSFTGSPTLSGVWNFSSGLTATTGTFSGQVTSTLATGTAPFVVASTTVVPNLNASLLLGCSWAAPCAIGSTTPNTGVFTTLAVNTSFTLNSGTTQTGTQGTGTKLLTAGTVAGNSKLLCTDAGGGLFATTTACPTLPVTIQNFTFCASGCNITGTPCSTSGASYAKCSTTITLPAPYTDANYAAVCQGITSTQFPYIDSVSKTSNTLTVVIANGSSNGAMVSTYSEIDCQTSHN